MYLKYHFGFFDSVVSHKEGEKSWLIAALCLWKNVMGNSLLSNSHHATDTAPLLWQCSPWCPWCSKGYLLFQENDTLEAASVQDNYRQDWQKQEGPGNPPLKKKVGFYSSNQEWRKTEETWFLPSGRAVHPYIKDHHHNKKNPSDECLYHWIQSLKSPLSHK